MKQAFKYDTRSDTSHATRYDWDMFINHFTLFGRYVQPVCNARSGYRLEHKIE